MKKLKLKAFDIKVKSFITSTPKAAQKAVKPNGGGYTWVG